MIRRAALALMALLSAQGALAQETDPASETVHEVRPGETLSGIANRAVVPRVLIIEANGLKPPYVLKAGQRLVIPRRRSHTVKAGETGFAIAMQYSLPWEVIATANGLDPKVPLKAGRKLAIPTLSNLPPAAAGPAAPPESSAPPPSLATRPDAPRFAWPAPGQVIRGFTPHGRRGAHDGIDIAGAEGSAVRAVAPGKVIFVGYEPRKYGYLVVIDHGKGWHTAYGKLQKVTVGKGDRARANERVGLLGHTGETPRTELHFEVRRYTLTVDPELVLPERD